MKKAMCATLFISMLLALCGCSEGISEIDSKGYLAEENGVKWLPTGVYEVGKDLPAGGYTVVPSSTKLCGYLAAYSDKECADMLCNGAMFGHQRVTVEDGQFLEISHALCAPSEKVHTNFDASNLTEGGYLVGVDIPSGTYVVESEHYSLGPVCIWDSTMADRDLIFISPLSHSFAFDVSDGQYLEVLSGAASFVP